jgi:predicted Zn-dependent protease
VGKASKRGAGIAPGMVAGILASVAMASLVLVSWTQPARAQRRGAELQLLSDAETENTIRGMVRPVFDAAGVDAEAVSIVLVNDNTLNAFVAGGQNIFLHTGILLAADASQLIGVIAHETGHIAGGHLVRGNDAQQNALLSSLIGLGLGVAGGIATGNVGAGMAGLMLGQHLAERNFLSFTRSQESAADQAALTFLDQAHMSARGMASFFEKLMGDEVLLTERDDAYQRTHPLSRERVEAVRNHVGRSPWSDRAVAGEWVERYQRVQAKLYGYLDPTGALRRYRADDRGMAARYGRAYAFFRRGDVRQALPLADGLIATEPRNAFFHEMRGDLLLQNGRPAEAVPSFRKAVELAADGSTIRVSLAHALLEQNDVRLADEAIRNLQIAAAKTQGQSSFLWRLTAQAWSLKHDDAMVAYASAEEALARGDRAMARAMAERAEKQLTAGSPAWLRAQDIRGQTGKPR